MAYTFRASSNAGNASGAAVSLTKPTGTADGDLLVVAAYLETDTNTWSSVPSGWSLAGSIINTGAFGLWVYWKTAASEPASWSWTPTTSNWRTLLCAAYSGGVTPAIDIAGTGGQADTVLDTAQTAPSVTTVSDNALVVYCYGNFGGVNPTGMSGFASNLRATTGGVAIADATKTPVGATGTSNETGAGSQTYAAIHIAFAIGAAGGVTLQQRNYPFGNLRGVMRGAI